MASKGNPNNDEGDERSRSRSPLDRQRHYSAGSSGSLPPIAIDLLSLPENFGAQMSLENFLLLNKNANDHALAHEIALNPHFKLPVPEGADITNSPRLDPTWTAIETSLHQTTVDYMSLIPAFEEIRDNILSCFQLPHQQRTRDHLAEKLDIELIKQQIDASAFEPREYLAFVIDTMAKFCAPIRDEMVSRLKRLAKERISVQVLKETIRLSHILRVDMANFVIDCFRNMLTESSDLITEYERSSFETRCVTLRKSGIDPLTKTKDWLTAACSSCPSPRVPPRIISHAFILLLSQQQQQEIPPIPESLILDHERISLLRNQFEMIILELTIVLVTKSYLKKLNLSFGSQEEFLKELRTNIQVCLDGVDRKEMETEMKPLAQALIRSMRSREEGIENLLPDNFLEGAFKEDHPVHSVIRRRMQDFLFDVFCSSTQEEDARVELPSTLALVKEEILVFLAPLIKIFRVNRTVYSSYYDTIIHSLP